MVFANATYDIGAYKLNDLKNAAKTIGIKISNFKNKAALLAELSRQGANLSVIPKKIIKEKKQRVPRAPRGPRVGPPSFAQQKKAERDIQKSKLALLKMELKSKERQMKEELKRIKREARIQVKEEYKNRKKAEKQAIAAANREAKKLSSGSASRAAKSAQAAVEKYGQKLGRNRKIPKAAIDAYSAIANTLRPGVENIQAMI